MSENDQLDRFIKYHEVDYQKALSEIRAGHKQSHWIWYIFPQLKGLGKSEYSCYFGLDGLEEAKSYYANETLRSHLREITQALLDLPEMDIQKIVPEIDARKLKSSMTLFDVVSPDDIFAQVLDRYFYGKRDGLTLSRLQ